MKKGITILICFASGIILFLLCYGYSKNTYPKEYYNVYLDGQLLGTVTSKEELEKYINDKTEHYINVLEETKEYCIIDDTTKKIIENASSVEYFQRDGQECAKVTTKAGTYVDNVYTPNGLKIEQILAYNGKLNSTEEIYNKIVDIKSFTIKGYQFTIKDEDQTSYIYVTDKEIFEKATKELIKTYVGEESYNAYLNNTQTKIDTTGTLIENIYIQEDISVKGKQIPVNEKIYTDYKELSQFLLFGTNPNTSSYIVKENEMIEDIALTNQISVQEFLISNTKYKDSKSLISKGTSVQIKQTNPQLKVVVESYVVEDKVNSYKLVYQYDNSQYVGYEKKIQSGQDGLERVKQTVQVINGVTVYVEPKGKEVLKASIDQIIVKGDKFIANVGDLTNWGWPSESGWTISDNYAWRTNPITGARQFHQAIDIAGTGYGSKVYAVNNGVIIYKKYTYDYGYYIVINHNNGYYTLYSHFSSFATGLEVGSTVARGQVIGYVGSTGYSTGPHIHFEVWKGCEYCRISPWLLYK